MKAYLPLLLGAAALLASCSGNKTNDAATTANPAASGTATTSSAPADVASLDQQFVSAWNSKNATQVSAMLADDVQFLQGETHFSGKDDVTNKWITPTINTISNLKTNSVSSSNTDALAYEAGTFSVDVPASGTQKAGEGQGNYVFVWKKAGDGTWKLSLAQLEDLPVQAQ